MGWGGLGWVGMGGVGFGGGGLRAGVSCGEVVDVFVRAVCVLSVTRGSKGGRLVASNGSR